MAAASTDKFQKVGTPGTATTLSAPGYTIADTNITVGSTTNWPTDTRVSFAIDRAQIVNGVEERIAGTYNEFSGIVTGATTIASLSQRYGTAQNYAAGSLTRVYIPVSSTRENDLIDGLTQDHNAKGNHKDLTDDSGNEWLKRNAVASAVNEITIANAATGTAVSAKATGGDTNVNMLADGKGTGLFIPRMALAQAGMINGKIVTSVSSNNLTVAIKTSQGNDPSANDPVYVRIGNTVRSIVAALSITKNAGTNWFSAGSAWIAASEVDYFVYLGYNATDGVVLGFARVPYAITYSDFSTTSTNERYAAISTITNAASTDEYEVVGRFNAKLSATASFNWSLPATSVIINRPIYESRELAYTPTPTGFTSTVPTSQYRYVIKGRQCTTWGSRSTNETSNSTAYNVPLPISARTLAAFVWYGFGMAAADNSAGVTTTVRAMVSSAGTDAVLAKDPNGGAWTAAGTKGADYTVTYEI